MSNFLTCEQLEPLLSAYHDGELSENERAEADKHISSCAACQNRVVEIAAISNSLKALPRLTPKMDVAANIEKLIAAQPKAANQIPRPLVWSALGVAAAAAVVLFVGNLKSGPNVVPNQVASNSTINASISKKEHATSQDLEVASNAVDDPDAPIIGSEKTQSVSEDSKKKDSPLPDQHGKPEAENGGKKERAKFNPHLQIASRPNDGGTDTIPVDATLSGHLDQQTGADSQLIASETTNRKGLGQSGTDSNLVAVYDTDQRNVTEELGITTDEDGLYAIKL